MTDCTPVMMKGRIVGQLWWDDLLYTSYNEGAYCMPVMMRGILYGSYDEGAYCTAVMMRGHIVWQLWWGGILYGSYDEEAYCTAVMMRGHIVRELWWGGVLYSNYDEGGRNKLLRMDLTFIFTPQRCWVVVVFCALAKYSRHAWSIFWSKYWLKSAFRQLRS